MVSANQPHADGYTEIVLEDNDTGYYNVKQDVKPDGDIYMNVADTMQVKGYNTDYIVFSCEHILLSSSSCIWKQLKILHA